MKTEIFLPTAHNVTQRIWVGGDPAQGLSFKFQTHEQYCDVGRRKLRLLMVQCVDLPCGTGPIKYIVSLETETCVKFIFM